MKDIETTDDFNRVALDVMDGLTLLEEAIDFDRVKFIGNTTFVRLILHQAHEAINTIRLSTMKL